MIEPFVSALLREIAGIANVNPGHPVHTIYFGGGTPTLMTATMFSHILEKIHADFDVLPDAEVSTEANPNDLADPGYALALREAGLNRLSIGVQSANQAELELFLRQHGVEDVVRSVENSRAAGFDNLSLDLIYGNPNQTMPMWAHSLDTVIGLKPEHLSLYGLGLEPDTALESWVMSGKVAEPDDDLAADMYDLATKRLAENRYEQYEISNWAQPGYESRHNLQYWYNHPYLGLGPGAHGWAGGVRYAVIRSPHRYIKLLTDPDATYDWPKTPALETAETVDRENEIAETLMMGMRLTKHGISRAAFKSRFGIDVMDLRREVIDKFVAQGLLHIDETHMRLTDRGRMLSNVVLRDLI